MSGARQQEDFDYVVVGGGSAGSVVAGRLAERGASVLVLEAGGTDRRLAVALPAGLPVAFAKCNWHLLAEPDPSRDGVVERWGAGKVLGGGGSINAGVFVRGNRADYDGWASAGCDGWDYDSVLPLFRRLESWEDGEDPYRGGGGPISVRRHRVPHVANDAFIAAAQEAGHPFTADYNGAEQEGVAVTQVNQRGHFRSQSSREYLRRLVPAGKVEVRTRALVSRVVFEGDRAVGVEYTHKRHRHVARAHKEVVLSAGALATPKLLMLSGIGPSQELGRLGLRPIVDAPQVGCNLQEHPAVILRYRSLVPTVNTLGPADAAKEIVRYVRHGEGFLATTVGHAQHIFRSDPALPGPDIQTAFANYMTRRELDAAGNVKITVPREAGFALVVMFLRPSARGRVSLRTASVSDPPRIEFQMLGSGEDVDRFLLGLEEVRRVMEQPAMRAVADGLLGDEGLNRTPEAWRAWLKSPHCHGGYHACGTCRMGADGEAVVDPELRVKGVDGLRVADASIIPRIPSGNTNAASMMIGEKAADCLLPA